MKADLVVKEILVCLFGDWNVFVWICQSRCRFVPHGWMGWDIQLLVDQIKIDLLGRLTSVVGEPLLPLHDSCSSSLCR
jgi:hypothetical protein